MNWRPSRRDDGTVEWILDEHKGAALAIAATAAALEGAPLAVNGWFPRIAADNTIASGNGPIWVTPPPGGGDPVQVSAVGIGPVWAGKTLVFNRNDGRTAQVGGLAPGSPWAEPIPAQYNDYAGSDHGEWAGFSAPGAGTVQRYSNVAKVGAPIAGACAPKFLGRMLGWLAPYQATQRALLADGVQIAAGIIVDWAPNRDGNGFAYAVANGTYTKRVRVYTPQRGDQDVTIREQQDEVPLACFTGPDDWPWLVSGFGFGIGVRNAYSAMGWPIRSDQLYYPDSRRFGNRVRVAASTSSGAPSFDNWIDFSAPRVDLRTL